MTPELERVFGSLPLFAANFLHIRTKSGRIEYFDFNRAQEYLHGRLEEQLQKTGKVRALILKGGSKDVLPTCKLVIFTKSLRSKVKRLLS